MIDLSKLRHRAADCFHRMTRPALLFLICGLFAPWVDPSQALEEEEERDYLAQNYPRRRLAPGARAEGCRFLCWNVPDAVPAGQQAVVEIGWQTLRGDPGETARVTVLGEWEHQDPIFFCQGFRAEPGAVMARRFAFRAPTAPGTYRMRWIITYEGEFVDSFFGHRPEPRSTAVRLAWAESDLHVAPAPATEIEDSPQRDWLAEKRADTQLKPGGPSVPRGQFRLVKWEVPKSVRAGRPLYGVASWQTTDGNPNASVYVSLIGDWQPDKPLMVLHQGYQGEPGYIVTKTFKFEAPGEPGTYRLRWILVQAFKPISHFYGKQNHSAEDPGHGLWAEATFEVVRGAF